MLVIEKVLFVLNKKYIRRSNVVVKLRFSIRFHVHISEYSYHTPTTLYQRTRIHTRAHTHGQTRSVPRVRESLKLRKTHARTRRESGRVTPPDARGLSAPSRDRLALVSFCFASLSCRVCARPRIRAPTHACRRTHTHNVS